VVLEVGADPDRQQHPERQGNDAGDQAADGLAAVGRFSPARSPYSDDAEDHGQQAEQPAKRRRQHEQGQHQPDHTKDQRGDTSAVTRPRKVRLGGRVGPIRHRLRYGPIASLGHGSHLDDVLNRV
jgi:hypothetical protein